MKERPIIFSAESVRAIIDGVKAQTRRVMKPQPTFEPYESDPGFWCWKDCQWLAGGIGIPFSAIEDYSPLGVPGDRLWVKEAFQDYHSGAESDISEQVVFYGDTAPVPAVYPPQKPKLKSPRIMPRKFSRLTLEITEVRCERLIDIKAQDVLAEGYTTKLDLINAWNALNAKRGFPWESNPWVWVLTFRKLKEEINHG